MEKIPKPPPSYDGYRKKIFLGRKAVDKTYKDKLLMAFITLSYHCWEVEDCANCIFFKDRRCTFSTKTPDKWKMPQELKESEEDS